ncbi:8-oxo-dGTP pyrophosphatase MutT (NUDIX family) [Actinokineospora baliensis]|uniref:NUDIX domain-containing protein n=1 Tax=Actinokineospora baliensis TaxID=547056 RepID=UPI001959B999|nr:NUDIX domain-containing protein [Actinokineospora baliensis]MBM7775637.1 8-oxo-dGTP pyrophosphatase MutT (NUDIX family) [Actinokineospora baliensis]
MTRGDGDRVVLCGLGHEHWGHYGAAGLLPVADGYVLLQQRGAGTSGSGTWGMFGGARDSHEDTVTAALREAGEESTLDPELVDPFGVVVEDHGGWTYETVIAWADERFAVEPVSAETAGAAWVPVDAVTDLELFAPFAANWTRLRECLEPPVLVVDCANVMGSRPDGWWRDRAGAAARLRDRLAAADGFPGLPPFDVAYPEIVLVVEGQARRTAAVPGVEVVSAQHNGDDKIVEVARENPGCVVVTADRELRARCVAVGAQYIGPGWLQDLLPD